MLAHLMSSANRNVKQRQAVVDLLNENQVCQIGKFLKQILNAKDKLPRNQIKQLIRDRNLIDAIITGRGLLFTRKSILKLKTKNQKGGFLSALLPVALSLAGPAIKGLGRCRKGEHISINFFVQFHHQETGNRICDTNAPYGSDTRSSLTGHMALYH